MPHWLITLSAFASLIALFAPVIYLLKSAQQDDSTPRGTDSKAPGGLYSEDAGHL